MECQYSRIIERGLIVSILVLASACGYSERDRTESQIDVTGNIKIQKQENSDVVSLVFAESPEIYAVIVDNCRTICYDSLNAEILVEEFINEANIHYYKVDVQDASNEKLQRAIRKNIITKNEFENSVSNSRFKRWNFR